MSWTGSLAVTLLLSGCVSVQEKQAAIEQVNAAFRECYERTLRARGTRYVRTPVERTLAQLPAAMETLGMTVMRVDDVIGYVRARGPAPAPLDAEEWAAAVERDRPRFRSIVAGEVGLLGWFVDFEPEGLDVVITVTAAPAPGGSNLSATMRMLERTPPPSEWPRREYPPCTALEYGLEKLWRAIDDTLGARTSLRGIGPRRVAPG